MIKDEDRNHRKFIDTQFNLLSKCLTNYSDIFDPKGPDMDKEGFLKHEVFFMVYGWVCTRSFGLGPYKSAIVPLADMFNHKDMKIIGETICKSLHVKGDVKSPYFTQRKYMNDYSALFDYDSNMENVKGYFDKNKFE